MKSTRQGGRKKLEPDPHVRAAILSAAGELLRENGVGALAVNQVLDRAKLGTRAFYRHFDSKDQLVSALFLDMARAEVSRLEALMAAAPDAVRAVAAWIDGRLDLAFNAEIRSDLRQMSIEAQSQMFASPELVGPAYREILRPLVEQLERGREAGLFGDIDPYTEAMSIQGAVWANVERQWAGQECGVGELRKRLQCFCLRGLGVSPKAIDAVVSGKTTLRNRPRRGSTR
jgi:AcrR family transcriptional regulator